MRVSTMLRKEKEGTLYKHTKLGESKPSLAKMREEEEKEEHEENTTPRPGIEGRIRKFFAEHPEPEDYEVHAMAQREGINAHHFEELVYKELAKHLKNGEKTSAVVVPMLDELVKLNAISPLQFEAAKLKEVKRPITTAEAQESLTRLKKLESTKATAGELGRAAGVGAVVLPIAALAQRVAAGSKGRVGLPIWRGPQEMASVAAHGAVLGSLLPAGRHKLEREVEKQKLREYVGTHRGGTLRGQIRKTMGV